jgi:hypothetical protein
MWKVLAGLGVVGAMGAVIAALFSIGVIGEVSRWCATDCGVRYTCVDEDLGEQVCEEVGRALHTYGWDRANPALSVEFVDSEREDKDSFTDEFGRTVAGHRVGSVGMRLARRKGVPLCRGALRHEVRHILLGLDGLDLDENHELPDWSLYHGCR